MTKSFANVLGLFSTAAAAIGAYVLVSSAVERGKTRRDDAKARRKIVRHSSKRAKRLAETTGHIGKWYTHVPAAAVGATALALTGHGRAAIAVGSISAAAAAASRILDRVHDHRTPPPGKLAIDPDAQSYPSGHALETTSVALASAWILAREQIVPAAIGFPIAALASVISGVGRLALDRHWMTDSAAGYCAGIALASTCAGVYELAK